MSITMKQENVIVVKFASLGGNKGHTTKQIMHPNGLNVSFERPGLIYIADLKPPKHKGFMFHYVM